MVRELLPVGHLARPLVDPLPQGGRLVLPERPAGTEHMTEDELAALVTRDAMIGTAKVSLAGGSP